MTFTKNLSITAMALIAILGVTACTDSEQEEAIQKMDKAIQDTGNAFDSAGDKISDTIDDAGDSVSDTMDDAGHKMSDMTDDAGNAIEDACEHVKEGVKAEDQDC
ncbi:hypothetical protein [Colwellia echini]|uniref:Uncharacterized protein n=1 Tax=Colwellia echini TaxID=1982103 RepID=A0ABY3MVD7_9GAMM|nr:hypothetical protein [Colwellia echini]TYK65096.1 hypothetical protein CWS31_012435 [Colwellia echini]